MEQMQRNRMVSMPNINIQKRQTYPVASRLNRDRHGFYAKIQITWLGQCTLSHLWLLGWDSVHCRTSDYLVGTVYTVAPLMIQWECTYIHYIGTVCCCYRPVAKHSLVLPPPPHTGRHPTPPPTISSCTGCEFDPLSDEMLSGSRRECQKGGGARYA